jgi:hypothetical protein
LPVDGSGNITSGFADVDENGTATSSAVTGTYSVNAAGYGTITLTPGATQDISVLGLYLVDPTINFADPNSPADGGLAGLLLDLQQAIFNARWRTAIDARDLGVDCRNAAENIDKLRHHGGIDT